jgi:2-dehydropantoate 2-reductase
VVRTVEEAANQQYTYIICAVKCLPDVRPTSEILGPLLDTLSSSPEAAIVLLQNGIGIEDDIFEALKHRGLNNPVISGCPWVYVTTMDGGKTISRRGNERLVLGYHRSSSAAFSETTSQKALGRLCNLLRLGGASVEPSDIEVARWRMVLWCAT